MLKHPYSLAMLLSWSTGGAPVLQQGATPAATAAGGWASLPGRRTRTCGSVGWVELVELVELLDDAGGGTGGDEAAGTVEEVLQVGPDGARAEAGDLHLAQRLGVQVSIGEVAFDVFAIPDEQAVVAGAANVEEIVAGSLCIYHGWLAADYWSRNGATYTSKSSSPKSSSSFNSRNAVESCPSSRRASMVSRIVDRVSLSTMIMSIVQK